MCHSKYSKPTYWSKTKLLCIQMDDILVNELNTIEIHSVKLSKIHTTIQQQYEIVVRNITSLTSAVQY